MENDLIKAAEKLLLLLSGRGLTLSLAESCTGGLISHAITSIPGALKVFHSSIVAYSIDSKLCLLGIDEDVINASGVISAETAKAMAENIRLKTGTDVSLSVTGNLGPDALEGKDVGVVYFAASSGEGVVCMERHFHGNRYHNKYNAAMEGVNLLINVVSKNI